MADEATPKGDSAVLELNARLRADNLKLREKRRALEAKVSDLEKQVKDGGLPEGAVVLKPDEAKAYEAFKALKLEPAKVQEALTEREALKVQLAERDRDALVRDAAELVGFNPKVLADQVTLRKLHLEIREVDGEEGEGKKKVPHVRPADDEKAALVPLEKYATDELPEYLPALTKSDDKRGAGEQRTAPQTNLYPRQPSRGSTAGSTPDPEKLAAEKHQQVDYSM